MIIQDILVRIIKKRMPELNVKLKQAGMDDSVEIFIKKSLLGATYLGLGLTLTLFLFFAKQIGIGGAILLFPVLYVVALTYLLRIPDARIIKREQEINREILFAGRFLIIELQSGVALYDSLKNASKHYKALGESLREIINKIDMGTPIEDAINESIEHVPSKNFRRMLYQIINSLRTGANIGDALISVVEQITRDQIIEISKYGRKLNPIAMFYMMVAVIIPSLGITMLVVLSTLMGLALNLGVLLGIAAGIGAIQFVFLMIIKNSRPAVEL